MSIRTQHRFHAFNTLCSTFLRAKANTSTPCVCVCERALGQEAVCRDSAGSPPQDIGSPRDLVTADSGFAKDAVVRGLVHLHQILYRGTSCPPLRHAHTYAAMLPCVSRGDAVAAASSPSGPPAQPLPRDVITLARAISIHSNGTFQAILSADNITHDTSHSSTPSPVSP